MSPFIQVFFNFSQQCNGKSINLHSSSFLPHQSLCPRVLCHPTPFRPVAILGLSTLPRNSFHSSLMLDSLLFVFVLCVLVGFLVYFLFHRTHRPVASTCFVDNLGEYKIIFPHHFEPIVPLSSSFQCYCWNVQYHSDPQSFVLYLIILSGNFQDLYLWYANVSQQCENLLH